MARVARARTRRRLAWVGYFVVLAGALTIGIEFGWRDEPDFRRLTLTPEATSRPVPSATLDTVRRPVRPTSETDRETAEARAMAAIAPAAGDVVPPPSFDIVRVARDGAAVLAGRAPAGARVTISEGGRPLTQIAARGGEWAVVLDTPLAPGPRALTVEATLDDGATLAGAAPVLVVVPARAEDDALAVRLAARTGEASVLLTQPPATGASRELALATADHDEDGGVVLTGTAPVGRTVRAYLDDSPIGAARAVRDGGWHLVPAGPVAPGRYRLRLDQIAADGTVEARVEVAFTRRAAPSDEVPETARRIVVEPGTNLWRIARRIYGEGMLFTTIYEANAGQIRDPDLIYPGQVFMLPKLARR